MSSSKFDSTRVINAISAIAYLGRWNRISHSRSGIGWTRLQNLGVAQIPIGRFVSYSHQLSLTICILGLAVSTYLWAPRQLNKRWTSQSRLSLIRLRRQSFVFPLKLCRRSSSYGTSLRGLYLRTVFFKRKSPSNRLTSRVNAHSSL